MHPEVQMHQMLFWKMSLASLPGGGSRGRGAGARHMQWDMARVRGQGRDGVGSEATALSGQACLPDTFWAGNAR